MASPYGGDRGGGRKSTRKPGGQPGNTNRAGSLILPRARDAEDRRKFIEAYKSAQKLPADEMAREVLHLLFARVKSLADEIGTDRLVQALYAIDNHRRTKGKLAGDEESKKRERLKDKTLGDVWSIVEGCEVCAGRCEEVLAALEQELRQL